MIRVTLSSLCSRLAFLSLLVSLSLATPAFAYCRKAGPISGGLKKLISKFARVEPGHTGKATVQDFLVGVSKIPPQAMAALTQRAPAVITAHGAGMGSVADWGTTKLQFSGIFARHKSFFRVPEYIHGHYRVANGMLTLYYYPGGALALGEPIPLLGIPFYRHINHVEITATHILFFWGTNAHGRPDRCYVAEPD